MTTAAMPDQIRQVVEFGQADLADEDVGHLAQRVVQLEEFLGRKRFLARGDTGGDQTPEAVRWHMVGPVPRGSVKTVVPVTRLIHSVNTLRLADDLHTYGARHEEKLKGPIEVLLQVNSTTDEKHPGIAAPAVRHLAEQIDTMVHLKLRGLMLKAPDGEAEVEAHNAIGRAADLYRELCNDLPADTPFNILSVVSDEHYAAAVAMGANMVCVGRPLFGDANA